MEVDWSHRGFGHDDISVGHFGFAQASLALSLPSFGVSLAGVVSLLEWSGGRAEQWATYVSEVLKLVC